MKHNYAKLDMKEIPIVEKLIYFLYVKLILSS